MRNQISTEFARLDQVTKVFGQGTARRATLNNVSFTARAGEMNLLLGPSGSGKTTLLTILAGFQSPTKGDAYLFGKRVEEYSVAALQRLRAQRIGFIFQTFYLFDSLTALENVMLVLKFAGVPKRDARSRALDYLALFDVSHLTNRYPVKFSQGEKQRVAVARALATRAQLIIADEPTGSLDTRQGMLIAGILKEQVVKDQLCVVVASHDERLVRYADRTFYLSDGILREETTVSEPLHHLSSR